MLNISLLSEYYSLAILILLFLRYRIYEKRPSPSRRRRMFSNVLLGSIAFIIYNFVCVFALEHPETAPRWLNIALNSFYFFFSIVLCSSYAYMLFDSLLEHVYEKHCMRRAKIMLVTVTALSTVLTVINVFTGWIFTVNESNEYVRGPVNQAYYIFIIAEIIFLCICFVRNRRSVSEKMLYFIKVAPIIILIIFALQLMFPDILLSGTMCATVSLTIYIAFRTNSEGHDSLTGLHNRHAFISELQLRSGSGQAVQIMQFAFLNISELNTRHGNATVDALLYEAARYISRCVPNIHSFRTSGTTFAAILPYDSEEEAEACIHKIYDRIQSEWAIGDVKCRIFAAAAELRTKHLTDPPGVIMNKLEYTLSIAKKNSGIERYGHEIAWQMEQKDSLLRLMRHSIDTKRFKVYYQPLYCCRKDIFCSAEALLRLSDYDGMPIRPDVFIPLAEENGMIEELTWIVLDDICKTLSSEKFKGLQSVSINLSMQQLLDPKLPEEIASFLSERGIAPPSIKLEMTERFLLHDSKYAKAQLDALKALGLDISMDDFGTGYSNLANVLEFPFGFIKLDRSLIAPIAENPHAKAMVGSLIKLFSDMDKRIIAEGVEDEAQVKILRELGIDMIQGYYYAKPAPADELIKYFSEPND